MDSDYTFSPNISSPQFQNFENSLSFTKFAPPGGRDLLSEAKRGSDSDRSFSVSERPVSGFWFKKDRSAWIANGISSHLEGCPHGVLSDSYLKTKKKVFKSERLVPLKPYFAVEACSDLHSPKIVSLCSCNDFLRCGVCRRKRLKRTQKRVRDYMVSMDIDKPKIHTMKFLTLTLKREGMSFEEARKKLLHAFTKLRKRKSWKKKVSFYFSTLEVVEGNVHLHTVLTSSFWEQAALSEEWFKITKTSFIVDIRKVSSIESATKELAKYIAKDVSPDVLEEVASFRDENKKSRYVFSGRRPPSLDTIAITSPKSCQTCNHKIELFGQFKDQIEAETWVFAQKRDPDGHIRRLSFPSTAKNLERC